MIAAVLAIILGLGWVGASLVGRTLVTLGPGVTLHRAAGWGESWVGPRGLWSQRWPIGDAILIVAPEWDVSELGTLLADYRVEVIEATDEDAVFDDPVPTEHPAGAAVIQHWTTVDLNGDPVVGELVVVVNGGTGVVLDGRWPGTESTSVVDEVRRVVASLSIEPLAP